MLLISFNFISDYLYDSHPVTQRPELSSRAQPGSRLGVYPGNTELRACSRSFTRRVAPKKGPASHSAIWGLGGLGGNYKCTTSRVFKRYILVTVTNFLVAAEWRRRPPGRELDRSR